MLHGPAVELGEDNATEKKRSLGIVLFFVYLLIYAGFVVIGIVAPHIMGITVLGLANIAFVYGMGLIVLAVLMGYFYNHFCTRFEDSLNAGNKR